MGPAPRVAWYPALSRAGAGGWWPARIGPSLDADDIAPAQARVPQTLADTDVDGPTPAQQRMRDQHDLVHARLFRPPDERTRIGRYVVEGTLGQGGMGKVLRAHDETLGRDVALKLLHAGPGSPLEPRLLREAQALARVAHPNVVQVYDVDEIDGRLCMAMELVHGQSLDRWQQDSHPWKEVVELYRQAGRGLAAAHAEGLVHRDFKPANCVVDERGGVKVLDFGLARDAEGQAGAAEAEHSQASGTNTGESNTDSGAGARSQRMLEPVLTRTGAMLGTLAYMAPEQMMGQPATPASDQFSFCVSLYEALYGRRPFDGRTAASRLYSIQAEPLTIASARAGQPPVPAWVFDVIQRGLSAASHQRFPCMSALLDVVEHGLARRRRIRRGALAAVLSVAVGGALLLGNAQATDPPCEALRGATMPAWTQDDRTTVETAFEASDLADARRIWSRVEVGLDRYATAWTEARLEACEATWVRREAGEQALARRMACLDRQIPRVRATVVRLANADAATVAHAVGAVDALPSLAACEDVETLLRGSASVPEARAEEAVRIRELIARSWAAGATGDQRHGVDAAERAVAAADTMSDVPVLQLEARYNRGKVYHWARRLDEAREDLEVALALAEQLDEDGLAVDVLRELIVVAADDGSPILAAAWLAATRGKLARVDSQPRRRAQRWALEGLVAVHSGRLDDAIRANTRAVELYGTMEAPPPDEVFEAVVQLGVAHRERSELDEAREVFERALALAEEHGRSLLRARAEYGLAFLHYMQGELPVARKLLEGALSTHDAFFGPNVAVSIRIRLLLAMILRFQGEHAAARQQARTAWESLDERSSPARRSEAAILLASFHRDDKRWDEAIARYRDARAAQSSEGSPDRVEVAMMDSNIADCLVAKGEFEAARPLYTDALRVLQVDTLPDDPRRAYPLLGRGTLRLTLGDLSGAIDSLRGVLALDEALKRDPALATAARWSLARALRHDESASDEASREAGALARQARVAFQGAGFDDEVEQIGDWLERCGPPCALAPG